MAQAPLERRECVLCGCCLEGCPLLAATGREELSPRAKALLAGPSKAALGALDEDAVAALAGLCLACGKCEKLCPQGVKVPELIARLRAEHPDFRQWLWKQWVTRLAPYWGLAARGAGAVPEAMMRALIPANFGLAVKGLRGLKPGAGLRPWLTVTGLPAEAFRAAHGQRPVAIFHGCVGGGPRHRWADMAMALLLGLGANLVDADFSCCGSTLGVAGLPDDQRRARLANVAAWRRAARNGEKPLIVTYCATCRKGLLEYASAGAGVFESEPEAAEWQAAVTPLSALLAGMTVKTGRGAPVLVAWHEPCHAAPQDLALLRTLLGTRLRPPAQARCCGFGGILQLCAPELSARVGADCWAGLLAATGADAVPEAVAPYVLTSCSGCVLQLSATGSQGSGAGHWLEILRPA